MNATEIQLNTIKKEDTKMEEALMNLNITELVKQVKRIADIMEENTIEGNGFATFECNTERHNR